MKEIFLTLTKFIQIKGIIQAGANVGQECNLFKEYTNKIIYFEPLPSVFQTLIKNNPGIDAYNIALGDKNETKKMYVASNNGESSSFLKPLNHLKYYNIQFNNEITVPIKRFDSLNIDITPYNVLVSDTQGYEVKVLKGLGEGINTLESIIIEYINSNLYENDSSLEDISNYITPLGFKLIKVYGENNGAGVALYIKNK